jgi:hypothetical protein
MAQPEPPPGTPCKDCGNRLDAFERMNYHHALQGNCVGCYISPKQTDMRQRESDLTMSPFTSIQRIQGHLTHAHQIPEGDMNEAISKLPGMTGTDIHEATAQHAWRGFHDAMHQSGHAPFAHHPSSTQLGPDEFENLFNDRRSS